MPDPFPPTGYVEQPVADPTGSGGLFGAIRRRILETPELYAIFGDRCHPGQSPPATILPHTVFKTLSSTSYFERALVEDGKVIGLNLWTVVFQVSVYAVGYDTARLHAQRLAAAIDRKIFRVDCYDVRPYVRDRVENLDPKRSEDGREVWHFGHRFGVEIPDFTIDGNYY